MPITEMIPYSGDAGAWDAAVSSEVDFLYGIEEAVVGGCKEPTVYETRTTDRILGAVSTLKERVRTTIPRTRLLPHRGSM